MSTDDKNYENDETVVVDTAAEVRETEAPRRPVSVPHLVMALVFLGIAGSWALHAAGVIASVEVQWLVPSILVVAGTAGLLVSLGRPRRSM